MKENAHYERLTPIMQKCGATVSARDFYWEVNLAYHEVESATYERDHRDLIDDIPLRWNRLLLPLLNLPQHSIRWIDIGCGPGVLGNKISEILGNKIQGAVCVDPSAAMIDQCRQASLSWPFPTDFMVGTIDATQELGQFNLVTANSVMHHVVELNEFCHQVVNLVAKDGYFITCYDPRYEAGFDRMYLWRETLYRRAREIKRKFGNVYRKIRNQKISESEHAKSTNEKLKSAGIITNPLDLRSIWAVTDFHVPNQPGNIGEGISLLQLETILEPLELDEYFTFQFFGDLKPMFPFSLLERYYQRNDDGYGQLFGARWLKKG